jgi:hypothetical protein
MSTRDCRLQEPGADRYKRVVHSRLGCSIVAVLSAMSKEVSQGMRVADYDCRKARWVEKIDEE